MSLLKRFIRDDSGMETVEYAVMAALIVTGLVTVVMTLGSAVSDQFGALTDEITSSQP